MNHEKAAIMAVILSVTTPHEIHEPKHVPNLIEVPVERQPVDSQCAPDKELVNPVHADKVDGCWVEDRYET